MTADAGDGPLVLRPHRLVVVCRVAAAALVVVFGVVALNLRRGAAGGQVFGPADQVAMFAIGLLLAGCVLLLTRARVEADATGIRVRNLLSETVLPWQVVAAVRLDDGSSWASLDLQDDDTVALLAVQSNDGERAVEAVLALRRLLRAAHAGGVDPGP
jgi:Bacterial PH domain